MYLNYKPYTLNLIHFIPIFTTDKLNLNIRILTIALEISGVSRSEISGELYDFESYFFLFGIKYYH